MSSTHTSVIRIKIDWNVIFANGYCQTRRVVVSVIVVYRPILGGICRKKTLFGCMFYYIYKIMILQT
jgi:hypothetical protein